MEVLIINGHDYSRYVERKGYSWSREDLDSENTGRTKAGIMRRDKITTKRKLSYTVMNMSRKLLAQLDNDLSAPTFSAIYFDLHGKQTRTFYCSSFSCALEELSDNEGDWGGSSFTIIEV